MLVLLKYFNFILYLFCITSVFAQEKKITVNLNAKIDDSLSVYVEIENNKTDTLVFLKNPFIIKGKSINSIEIHPWPGPNYTVNVLYYEQDGSKFSFIGDSDIKPKFKQFPNLIMVPPDELIKMRLLLPEKYIQNFQDDNYKFWITLSYAYKSKLDTILYDFPNLFSSYKTAITQDKSYLINVKKSLNNYCLDEISLNISQIIWKGFSKKISSNSVTLKTCSQPSNRLDRIPAAFH